MKDDGGPVFPRDMSPGISKREFYAAMAMQGMLTGCVGTVGNNAEITAYAKGHCNSAIVDRAFAIADAMIAASKGAEDAN